MENKDEQTDMSNKPNIIESEHNNNFVDKNSEEFRHVNQQKIKINKTKIKNVKDKEIKIETETNSNPKIIIEDTSLKNNLLISRQSHYDKIKRYFRGEKKTTILKILILISSIILFISIIDIINSIKNFFNNDKLLINNIFIFLIQILYMLCLLSFQILTIVSERKDNFIINLILLLILFALFISRLFIYIKKSNENSNLVMNFVICVFSTIINIIIFLITLRIIKIKKSEQQNIEEIINITDIQHGTSFKIGDNNNQLIMNNSGTDNKNELDSNNKDGITNLVEESEPNNKEDNNEQK
jgi:hypothetical protein